MRFSSFLRLMLAAVLAGIGGACLAAPAADYERIFVSNCAVCHGERGDGRSRAQTGLNPPPRDFTSDEAARELTRERMIHSVTFGRPGTAMMSWANRLRPQEIEGVVDYIRARFMHAAAGAASGAAAAMARAAPAAPGPAAMAAPGSAHAQPARGAAGKGESRGATIFRTHCSTCHGDQGAGASWAAGSLRPPPRNFTAPEARGELTLDRMLHSVTHGRPGTAMMAFESRLGPDDIRAVVMYIRSEFMGLGADAAGSGAQAAMPAAPGASAHPSNPGSIGASISAAHAAADMSLAFAGGLRGDARRGEAFYMANCRTCHGERGDGRGPRSTFIEPPPRNFLSEESRRALNRPALFTAISNGKRGTVMPAWKTVLDGQQIADVAEFVFTAFVQPAPPKKKTELSPPLESGREIYNRHCYFCHGYDGNGRTLAARFLAPAPRDFTALAPGELGRERMIAAVREGRPGTAMKPFASVLDAAQIAAVVDFVSENFIAAKRANTVYHTPGNGWSDHGRYRDAYPFALGEIALDARDEDLTPAQRRGKQMFMTSCITCHDRARVDDDRTLWAPRAVSYPRAGYSHVGAGGGDSGGSAGGSADRAGTRAGGIDADTGATPYARHDRAPVLMRADARELHGERIFQEQCAFCHAADGSGANWIGSFLQPPPRNLTDAAAMAGMEGARLRAAIANGVEGSAMPAWRTVLGENDIDAVASYVEKAFIAPARPGTPAR